MTKKNKLGGNPIVFLEIKNTSFVSTVKYLNELSEDATFNNIEVEQNKLPISEEQLENAKTSRF